MMDILKHQEPCVAVVSHQGLPLSWLRLSSARGGYLNVIRGELQESSQTINASL